MIHLCVVGHVMGVILMTFLYVDSVLRMIGFLGMIGLCIRFDMSLIRACLMRLITSRRVFCILHVVLRHGFNKLTQMRPKAPPTPERLTY
jgi:hypothetical protein